MRNRKTLLPIVAVGLALGTAWAVRGKFGHEQGAAWAGAIGALSLILVAKRRDWYPKTFRILMAAAFGWGISGMMSYGVIVGYGRATDFLNAFYGLLMLFVLGALYGFLGGGFFGLALVDSKTLKVKWHSLLAEMVAIGLLTYGLLINQLEWLMTPPRSELWAVALGASIALSWFIARNQYASVMKVAVWSALGAGFGFGFGNFLQVIGNSARIDFNFWNVMEYSIGFFGGAGMAYGTFTSSWPAAEVNPSRGYDLLAIVFVVLFIPFVVWEQSFVTERFEFVVDNGGSAATIFYIKLVAIISILLFFWFALTRNYSSPKAIVETYPGIRQFFILYTALYIFLSFLVTGLFVHPPEQYLYIINLLLILFLISRAKESFEVEANRPRTWLTVTVTFILIVAILAFIAINSHEGMRGSNLRFEINE
jgi:hypothetical protein